MLSLHSIISAIYLYICLETLLLVDIQAQTQINENCECDTFECDGYKQYSSQFNECITSTNNSLWISIEPIQCTNCISCHISSNNSSQNICTCDTQSNCSSVTNSDEKNNVFWWVIIGTTIGVILIFFIAFTIYFLCKVIRDDDQLAMKHIQRQNSHKKSFIDDDMNDNTNNISNTAMYAMKTDEISNKKREDNTITDTITPPTVVVTPNSPITKQQLKKIDIVDINVKDINLTEIDEAVATPLIETSDNGNRKVTISIAESESMNDNDYNDVLEEIGHYKSNSLQPKNSQDTDTVGSNDDPATATYLHNKYESFAL